MTNPTVPSTTPEVKPKNRRSKKHCRLCNYALYADARCSNWECADYRDSGPISFDKLIRDFAPPPLYHGRRWGSWTLDTQRLCLSFNAAPVRMGDGSGRSCGVPGYVAYHGAYEVDIQGVRDSASMLDWIFQVNKKVWADARVMRDLLNALNSIFRIQQNLCGGALNGIKGRRLERNFLRSRIAESKKAVAA